MASLGAEAICAAPAVEKGAALPAASGADGAALPLQRPTSFVSAGASPPARET